MSYIMNSLIRVYCNRKMLTVLLVGFASGLPLSLTGSTLQAWMSDAKVDITLIGIFSLVGIPYSFKFVWAPLMDRYIPSFLGRPFLGKRRGWIFITQIILALALVGMAFSNPSTALTPLTVFSLAVAFFSASQDIVIDAYKIELLPPEEFGAGAAMANLGYRLAMLFSGAVALILADHMSWQAVYLLMAASMAVFSLMTLLAPKETLAGRPPVHLKKRSQIRWLISLNEKALGRCCHS